MRETMSNQQELTAEQYVTLAKIDSLAKQNAQQAIRIADLEAQLSLYQQQQQQAQNEASEQNGEQAPAEFEPVEVEAH
jgi:predicted nucleotide-binding protein (sugar kinase/HSP70/actin superfamily)